MAVTDHIAFDGAAIIERVAGLEKFRFVGNTVAYDKDEQEYKEVSMTVDTQRKEMAVLVDSKPHVFLERYGKYLTELELEDFAAVNPESAEVNWWVCHLLKSGSKHVRQNRRLQKMQLLREQGFFDIENMKTRAPHVYHELVGKYEPRLHPKTPLKETAMKDGSFAEFLIDRQQDRDHRELVGDVHKANPKGEEEDSDEEWDQNDDEIKTIEQRKEEFQEEMEQLFLAGKDDTIDYEEIDCDALLDDSLEAERDAEDRYFDE